MWTAAYITAPLWKLILQEYILHIMFKDLFLAKKCIVLIVEYLENIEKCEKENKTPVILPHRDGYR